MNAYFLEKIQNNPQTHYFDFYRNVVLHEVPAVGNTSVNGSRLGTIFLTTDSVIK